jgi:hypothetical protein
MDYRPEFNVWIGSEPNQKSPTVDVLIKLVSALPEIRQNFAGKGKLR